MAPTRSDQTKRRAPYPLAGSLTSSPNPAAPNRTRSISGASSFISTSDAPTVTAQPSDAAGPSMPRPKVTKKREVHNAIERDRRNRLNERFLDLAAKLPATAAVRRPSKNLVIMKSLQFVIDALAHEDIYRSLIEQLLRENVAMRAEINESRAAQQTTLLQPSPGIHLPATLAEIGRASHNGSSRGPRTGSGSAALYMSADDEDEDEGEDDGEAEDEGRFVIKQSNSRRASVADFAALMHNPDGTVLSAQSYDGVHQGMPQQYPYQHTSGISSFQASPALFGNTSFASPHSGSYAPVTSANPHFSSFSGMPMTANPYQGQDQNLHNHQRQHSHELHNHPPPLHADQPFPTLSLDGQASLVGADGAVHGLVEYRGTPASAASNPATNGASPPAGSLYGDLSSYTAAAGAGPGAATSFGQTTTASGAHDQHRNSISSSIGTFSEHWLPMAPSNVNNNNNNNPGGPTAAVSPDNTLVASSRGSTPTDFGKWISEDLRQYQKLTEQPQTTITTARDDQQPHHAVTLSAFLAGATALDQKTAADDNGRPKFDAAAFFLSVGTDPATAGPIAV